jgi:hypothetical protein
VAVVAVVEVGGDVDSEVDSKGEWWHVNRHMQEKVCKREREGGSKLLCLMQRCLKKC